MAHSSSPGWFRFTTLTLPASILAFNPPFFRCRVASFASNVVGTSWEANQFYTNLRLTRQNIAEFLFSKDVFKKIPNLKHVVFRQCKVPVPFGGSGFGNDLGRFDLIYVVNYLPSSGANADTKVLLTLKIQRSKEKRRLYHDSQEILSLYGNAFQAISQSSIPIGQFSLSLWDWSAVEWQEFCLNYQGVRDSMDRLIAMANLRGDERVADVAAGTGDLSTRVLTLLPNGHLTVIEASPGMLYYCKRAMMS